MNSRNSDGGLRGRAGSPPNPKAKKPDSALIAYGVYGAIGFQLASMVVGGVLLGSYLDKKWHTSPWLTLLGLLVGSVGGFYNLIRVINWRESKNGKNDRS